MCFLFVQVEEEISGTPVLPTKQKDTVKEEAAANSPSKPTPSGSAKGAPATAKTAKGKRKNGEDVKPSTAPPKKMKTESVWSCHLIWGLSSEKVLLFEFCG